MGKAMMNQNRKVTHRCNLLRQFFGTLHERSLTMFDRIPKLAESVVSRLSRRNFLGKFAKCASILVGTVGTMLLFPKAALAVSCPQGTLCQSVSCQVGQCLYICGVTGQCQISRWLCIDPLKGGGCPSLTDACGGGCPGHGSFCCTCCCGGSCTGH
jgi:hypothetical protein